MVEKLYCRYLYSGKPDAGGRYDSVNWFKWGTELLRELRAVPALGDNPIGLSDVTEIAIELARKEARGLNDIDVTVIDVKGLRN